MEIQIRKLNEITPYAKNPRQNDRAVDEVIKSIKIHGQVKPLILSAIGQPFKKEIVCCGHTTLKALKKMGIDEVKVLVVSFKNESDFVDYNLRDNKTQEFAKWDIDLLGELKTDMDIDLSNIGFNMNIFESTTIEIPSDPDERPEKMIVVKVPREKAKQARALIKKALNGMDYNIS